ncbi:DUF4345 domain-containing protein [Aureivirga sp. CE67]|uniref:DUF4345 domain-containing protein n=1 Tax=Aureivirga sp. CE67 TaxID=1788983 RepID=UPI0018C99DB0|nr:DUF4345 domain-containing protein [Aureivirga sp. CE67]
MKNSKVLKIFLVISGLILAFIGGSTLIIPTEMKTTAAIEINGNVNLLNDVRAFGMLVLSVGILTISGAFNKKLTFTSNLTSSLLFLTLGLGRLISIIVDGMPVDSLQKATGLEFVLGIIGLILFLKNRNKQE